MCVVECHDNSVDLGGIRQLDDKVGLFPRLRRAGCRPSTATLSNLDAICCGNVQFSRSAEPRSLIGRLVGAPRLCGGCPVVRSRLVCRDVVDPTAGKREGADHRCYLDEAMRRRMLLLTSRAW